MGNNKKQRNHNANKRLTIMFFLIGLGITFGFGIWQLYLAYTTPDEIAKQVSEKFEELQISKDSSIKTTVINQDIVNCEILPDGQAGLSYYNKTLGFSVSLPNVNWSITEDNGYYVSTFGMIEHEKFLGGIMIDQKFSPNLFISVFDDSELAYVHKFLNEVANQISKKIEWKYVTINDEPDDNSGSLEAGGIYREKGFYIFEQAIRSDDKIYLIHYPNTDSGYPKNILDEIDEIYLSINIFPSCEL